VALPRDVRSYRRQMDIAMVEQLYSNWKQAVRRVL
jgi:hypothetical protein